MRWLLALAAVFAIASACGIKAAPKPPLEATAAETPAPDAGCTSCAAAKP